MVTRSNSNSSTSGSNATAAAKPKTRTRKPPVAERVTVSAVVAVPQAHTAATPPPPQDPTPDGSAATGSPLAAEGTPGGGAPAPVAPAAPVGAPPPATIPGVPSGFVPANPADFKGYRAMASQVAIVPEAIAELQMFTGYTSVFGITAPDVLQLVQRLTVAYQWTLLLTQTSAWYKYAKSQQGMGWMDAVLLVNALKAPFDLAAAANPALLSQYPAIARLLGAKAAIAKRSASTKAKNKSEAVKAALASAAAAPTQPAVAAPAPGGTTGSAAPNAAGAPAPTRIVTVQG